MRSILMLLLTLPLYMAADPHFERNYSPMNKTLKTTLMLVNITENLIHVSHQLMESSRLFTSGKAILAIDVHENALEELGPCMELLKSVINTLNAPDACGSEEADEVTADAADIENEDFVPELDPSLSPETCAAFRHMMELTDMAITREHLSRFAAISGMQCTADQMHAQSEGIWDDAFDAMCNYVAMCHDDAIASINMEK